MARTHRISRYRRWLAGVLAALIGLGPLLTPAYAQVTPLADSPFGAQVKAKPNLMLTVDDSSSMLYDFLPDSVIGTPSGLNNYCRDITGRMNAQCGLFDIALEPGPGHGRDVSPGYAYEQFGFPYPAYQSTIRSQGSAGVSVPKPIDNSGPGAGCAQRCTISDNVCSTIAPIIACGPLDGTCPVAATCSGGIDAGALPGLERYPNTAGPKSPKAGDPYQYWSLWPAPAHNAELNHIYYNPKITYDPPVDATGAPYAQMNATNTANWTHVWADPWAETIKYVDLTTQATIGIWCNSDWSIGHESESAYCRTNGTGAGAASSKTPTANGDYLYPWAPPSINPDDGVQPTTAKSIALSKVVFNPTTHKYDLKPAWATAQDPKYFYENDNILWCDPTNPRFPASGTISAGTCNAAPPTLQTCVGEVTQSCAGGTQSNCVGVTSQSCGGVTPQTCALMPQTCGGSVPQTCAAAPAETCVGVGHQHCSTPSSQTCNGVVDATCGGLVHEACLGGGPQTCNIPPPVCVPPAPTCGSYDPLGCETTCHPGDAECSCSFLPCDSKCDTNPSQSCTLASECPARGTCSSTGAFCDAVTPCAILSGACSPDSGISCSTSNNCPLSGTCLGAFCHAGDTCHQDGHCSATGAVCTGSASGECPDTGSCSIVMTDHCTVDTDCVDQQGHCSITTGTPCFTDPTCFQTARCSGDNHACTTLGSTPECPDLGGVCTIDFAACTPGSCTAQAGHCTGPVGNVCHSDGDCLPTGGQCSVSHAACDNVVTFCPDVGGTCDSGATTPAGGCFNTSQCPIVGATCTVDTGNSCAVATQATDCPTHKGYCSGDPLHALVCTTADAGTTCPPIPSVGTCEGFLSITCTANSDCPVVGSDPAAAVCGDLLTGSPVLSLLEDANGPGVVCRHNNRDYGAGANRYDYPNAQYNTPVSGGTGPNACVASPRYATVARHYWKTSVEWCDSANTLPGDQWLGYGKQGTCQGSSDASHSIPRFYQFGAENGCSAVDCTTAIPPSAAYLDNYATPAFRRMDLNALLNPTFTHDFIDDSHTPVTIDRSFAEEMTNYANWFAYYRTRITAVKTVTSLVFKDVDAQYRVGFESMYVDPSTHNVAKFLNIADFTGAQPGQFYQKLFEIVVPLGQQTPTLETLIRIGEHYKTGAVAGLPGSTDPITLSCQKNWHLLFTDGYTNQPALPVPPVGDQDDTVPATYPGFGTDPIGGLVPGSPWPHPYREDPSFPASDSLSDYATHYWVTDLRGGMPDNVPTCPSPRDVTCTDPANWQHVNFAAVSLGTAGKLSASDPSATLGLLTSGALQWPPPTPSVNKPDRSGVDDLWHAAINGRGDFVNAETPIDVQQGVAQIVNAVIESTGTRAGAGFVSNTFSSTAKFLYRAQFIGGWGGSLAKIQFDPMTGTPGALQWDAADRLTAQLVVNAGHPTPWFTERKIVTMTPAGPKPFLWANLSASQKDSLAPGKPTRGQAIVEFLRGNRAKEGVKVGQFRKRPVRTVLGDIVDSSPVFVGAPAWPFTDDNDPGYSAFATGAAATRAARVYVGANDGMLHAFDDVTGNETWAYIPSPLYRPDATGLGGLSYQIGAFPPFRHHYYVDSTPRVVDVDFDTPPSGNWHTILVGGMGKGGNRYYALDVTSPVDGGVTEAASTAKVLWEFPPLGDTTTDMGYTYGRPFIAKTRAFNGEWLVIVPVGYNNPSGVGKLYFLRARDGFKEMELSTGFGSAAAPAGLAHAAGYTKDFRNQLIEQIYAGDLFGNFWRFDVSDPNPGNWTVGQLALLVDPHGDVQPVTTPPEIKVDPDNGVDRWVFVGTGRLLDDSDLIAPSPAQQQTMYAFRDGTDTTPLPLPGTPLKRTTVGMESLPNTSTATHFGLAAKPDKGWFDDLPPDVNGQIQRIIVAPAAAAGVIAYVGTSPPLDDPCLTGLPATIYARAYSTGQSLLVDSDSVTILPSIYSDTGGVGVAIVGFETAAGTTSLDVRVAITGFDGSVKYYKTKPGANSSKYRMSWRLLGQ